MTALIKGKKVWETVTEDVALPSSLYNIEIPSDLCEYIAEKLAEGISHDQQPSLCELSKQ